VKSAEQKKQEPSIFKKILKTVQNTLQSKIQVYALIGPSGTGKSFRARIVADRFKIRFIIDDGILIKDKRIIAGRSAKRENAYLAAVKVAIFADPVHRHDVMQSLEKNHCKKVLILATSDRMIHKICHSLKLPPPGKILSIYDVAQADDIQKALENRKLYGRHVIPVPAKEVRRVSANIVTDEIKLWSQNGLLKTEKIYEKTLVRPEFSSGEALEVPDHILKQAIKTTLEALSPGARLVWFRSQFNEGYHLQMGILLPEEQNTDAHFERIKGQLQTQIRKQTGANVKTLDIKLRQMKPRKR